tara:strand:- start:78 stop:809 length:732 start_codon:yes stop_codon:yes gene_type:complete
MSRYRNLKYTLGSHNPKCYRGYNHYLACIDDGKTKRSDCFKDGFVDVKLIGDSYRDRGHDQLGIYKMLKTQFGICKPYTENVYDIKNLQKNSHNVCKILPFTQITSDQKNKCSYWEKQGKKSCSIGVSWNFGNNKPTWGTKYTNFGTIKSYCEFCNSCEPRKSDKDYPICLPFNYSQDQYNSQIDFCNKELKNLLDQESDPSSDTAKENVCDSLHKTIDNIPYRYFCPQCGDCVMKNVLDDGK